TPGLSNEVCWTSKGAIVSFEIFLDEGCDTVPDSSIVLAPDRSCFRFDDLVDGQKYCYWVIASDRQGRRDTSEVDSSIQDATAPQIASLAVEKGHVIEDRMWVFEPVVKLKIVANDTEPGKIKSYQIFENSTPDSVADVSFPGSRVDETVDHTISSPPKTPFKLGVKVFDAAGNESALVFANMDLLYEDGPDRSIFAFPNPFNPMKEGAKIRVQDETETEVRIYDFFGNLVRVLREKASPRDFLWNGMNGKGQMVANGVYICVARTTKARFKIGVKKQRL
ncbi:MAG: FlgD immunoglobulin-like domain containing protein, partial [bacterium]